MGIPPQFIYKIMKHNNNKVEFNDRTSTMRRAKMCSMQPRPGQVDSVLRICIYRSTNVLIFNKNGIFK